MSENFIHIVKRSFTARKFQNLALKFFLPKALNTFIRCDYTDALRTAGVAWQDREGDGREKSQTYSERLLLILLKGRYWA
jgi:hypothetical protein